MPARNAQRILEPSARAARVAAYIVREKPGVGCAVRVLGADRVQEIGIQTRERGDERTRPDAARAAQRAEQGQQ